MARRGGFAGPVSIFCVAFAASLTAAAAWPQDSPPRGLESLRAAAAGGPDAVARLDRVILRLTPEAGRVSHRALRDGFRAGLAAPGAVELDALLEARQVRSLRRVFGSFEDAQGLQRDSARARVTRLREARAQRSPGFASGARAPSDVPDLENFFVAEVAPLASLEELQKLLAQLRANELVVAAQPEYVYTVNVEPLPAVSYVPDDPFVSSDGLSWSEGAFGNDFPDLYGLRNIRAFESWSLQDTNGNGATDGLETGPGEGVVVAVIDTGLDLDHPDIAANVWTNPGEIPGNGVDDDANGFIDDVTGWDFVSDDADPADGHGHGTHVSGTIAARANNGEGIAGVAPFARIMPLKGLSDAGSGGSADLAAAIEYATAQGADITSNSWGGFVIDPVIAAAFEVAEASGVLNIAAAGNDGSPRLLQPAHLPTVMAVAAVDHEQVFASFTNYGLGTELAAPGVRVLSLSANDHDSLLGSQPSRRVGDHYLLLSGTSMACPHASGAAAVLMSQFPDETAAEIRGRLRGGAMNIDAFNPGLEGEVGSGQVDLLGSSEATPRPLIQISKASLGGSAGRRNRDVDVRLTNFWAPAGNVTATLTSNSSQVQVRQGSVALGSLTTGEMKTATFVIAAPGLEPGAAIDLDLEIDDGEGGVQQIPLPLRAPFFEDVTEITPWAPSQILSYGVSFGDFDHDGATDFAIGEFFERMRLFHNEPDGTFSLSRLGSTQSRFPIYLDVDGDGDRDMLAASAQSNLAFNDGAGTFSVQLPAQAVFSIPNLANATPLDLDRDGDLDLALTSSSIVQGHVTFTLENDGTGAFTDVWATSGIPATSPGGGTRAVDYDGDGDTDLIQLSGMSARPLVRIYENDGTGFFTDVSTSKLPPRQTECPPFTRCSTTVTLAVGDYDNDADLDIFVAGGDFLGGQSAWLFRQESDGTFSDVTASAGELISTPFVSGEFGTDFFDLENDGDLDIIVAYNNAFSGTPEGALEGTNPVFRNNGDGTFSRISGIVFPNDTPFAAFHMALGDYDGDGGIDLFGAAGDTIIEVGGLLRNVADRGAWLELELRATASPTDGYGATIVATANGRPHLRTVHYSPMDASVVHIGLGEAEVVDRLEVRWPSGLVQMLENVPVNERRIVREVLADCPGDTDSDADGVCNASDNCLYRANGTGDPHDQVDSDGDGFGNSCDPDLDNDGLASLVDVGLAILSLDLTSGDPGFAPGADIDGDGAVTHRDLDRIVKSYGAPPGPSGLACADATGATAPCTAGD